MNLSELKEPFPASGIEWRLQQCGEKSGKIWAMCLAYVTNRAIMDRLDEVCGADKWKNEFTPGPHGGVLCGISILINSEWITKYDGAENTDIEAVKGGLSGAMKRAAVQWGIGRYLYDIEEGFAEITDNGKYRGKTKENKYFKWNPPKLPSWALPGKPETKKDEINDTTKQEALDSAALEKKIRECTTLPGLKIVWDKNQTAIKSFTEPERKQLEATKDMMKTLITTCTQEGAKCKRAMQGVGSDEVGCELTMRDCPYVKAV